MSLVRFIDFLRDRLGLVIKVSIGLLALLVAADIARVVLSHGHEAAEATGEHAEAVRFLGTPLSYRRNHAGFLVGLRFHRLRSHRLYLQMVWTPESRPHGNYGSGGFLQ
ncbi:MAG: hypothetical protein IPP19_11495 [Verrucomicrobia bacterium]|nr:hypothetical protein [Verrucomicrobiota bacterium]